MQAIRLIASVALVGGILAGVACTRGDESDPTKDDSTLALPAVDATKAADLPHLENVVAYGEGLYSGAAPEGPESFDTIRAMGVTTIISVDGAAPDVESAKALGLRYIHLPIGYNGMTTERQLEIAKAIDQAEGPVYLHCHHGKHRSAGAAGAAAVSLGILSNLEAEQRMKVSGASLGYTGLYACVANAKPATKKDFKAVRNDFPEVWKTRGMVSAMVEIQHAYDHLLAIEKAGWKVPAESPDLVPAAEAGHLADLLRNIQDDADTKAHPQQFTQWLLASSEDTEALEAALVAGNTPPDKLSELLKLVAQSCKDCHISYRDKESPR